MDGIALFRPVMQDAVDSCPFRQRLHLFAPGDRQRPESRCLQVPGRVQEYFPSVQFFQQLVPAVPFGQSGRHEDTADPQIVPGHSCLLHASELLPRRRYRPSPRAPVNAPFSATVFPRRSTRSTAPLIFMPS